MKDEVIKQLADKLGVAVDVLWAALLKQAPIAATIDLMISVAVGVFIFFAWKLALKCEPRKESYLDLCSDRTCAVVVAFLVTFVLGGIALVSLNTVLAGFFNPEYWALKQILPLR